MRPGDFLINLEPRKSTPQFVPAVSTLGPSIQSDDSRPNLLPYRHENIHKIKSGLANSDRCEISQSNRAVDGVHFHPAGKCASANGKFPRRLPRATSAAPNRTYIPHENRRHNNGGIFAAIQ